MRTPTILCLAAASVLAAGCAGSSGPQFSAVDKNFMSGIGSYDQNRDGAVTCDEWRTAASNLFTRANRSGSGVLSDAEFQALSNIDRTFQTAGAKYYDANGDGKIEKKEFVERPNPAFVHGDKDKDCRLTEPELASLRSLSAPPQSTTPRTAVTTGSPSGPVGGY